VFTSASVDCADRIVATSSSNAVVKCSSVVGAGVLRLELVEDFAGLAGGLHIVYEISDFRVQISDSI